MLAIEVAGLGGEDDGGIEGPFRPADAAAGELAQPREESGATPSARSARRVRHRQVVVTLPKILRPYFKFERSLLTDLARWVYECLRELMAPLADEPVRPGCVAVLELAGNLLNLQPHVHLIVTSGAFDPSGARFYPLPAGFLEPLEALVRERVLKELAARGLLSEERLRLLRSWRRSGFSVHVGRPIAPDDAPGWSPCGSPP